MTQLANATSLLPGRPGNIKMKCMIWENQPVNARLDQNEVYPLSYETLKTLPPYIVNKLSASPDLQGVWLHEKIIYHNNFLFVNNQIWGNSSIMSAYFNFSTIQMAANDAADDVATAESVYNQAADILKQDLNLYNTTQQAYIDIQNSQAYQNPNAATSTAEHTLTQASNTLLNTQELLIKLMNISNSGQSEGFVGAKMWDQILAARSQLPGVTQNFQSAQQAYQTALDNYNAILNTPATFAAADQAFTAAAAAVAADQNALNQAQDNLNDAQNYANTVTAAIPVPIPLDDETPHFMWNLDGSLFDSNNVTPEQIITNPSSVNPKYSQWSHIAETVPVNNTDGNTVNTSSSDSSKLPPTQVLFPTQTVSSIGTAYWAIDKTLKSIVGNTVATVAATLATGGIASGDGSGVHWKVTKQTPLFQGEDFFIEFRKKSYTHDCQNTTGPLLNNYNFLDSSINSQQGFIVNAGVVDVDNDLNIIDQSRATFNFNSQPYYIIELGSGNPDHNYYIIIAKNAPPRCVHVSSTVPVMSIGSTYDDVSGSQNTITFTTPTVACSRLLGTYDDGPSSTELLSKDTLTIKIRQHLGNLVVTFVGYEGNPWKIERKDSVLDSGASNSSTPGNYQQPVVPMIIAAAPISIYGGNQKVSWSFGPLIYDKSADFVIPQAIVARGPISQQSLNLRLAEQTMMTTPDGKYVPDMATDAEGNLINTVPGNVSYVYNQDAEVYQETINGNLAYTQQFQVQPDTVIQQGKVPDKDCNLLPGIGNSGPANSFIAIFPTRIKTAVPPAVPTAQDYASNNVIIVNEVPVPILTSSSSSGSEPYLGDIEQMAQQFYAEYILAAGDYQFAVPTDSTGSVPTGWDNLNPWTLQSCITPVATGWRLYVAAAGCPSMPDPVDVSAHVISFNDSWTAQDVYKVDHSGTIQFLISSEQTGVAGTDGDYSDFLAALHDKTFYIRIYAWWDGGFMSCLPNCDCDCAANCMDDNVIFTGLCHGGQITTEGSAKKIMECQLLDYWKILQDNSFLNSPFFDGMRDWNAISIIMKMAGFRDGTETELQSLGSVPATTVSGHPDWAPLSLLMQFANNTSAQPSIPYPAQYSCQPSQVIVGTEYVLPSAYDILQSPIMKFADTSKFEDAIVQMAQKAGKMVYFDRWGVFHCENRPEETWMYTSNGSPLDLCVMNFYASPLDFGDDTEDDEGNTLPGLCSAPYQQVIGTYTYRSSVADVFNVIHIFASTPDGGPVFADNVNWASIYDPTQPGYIGYRKLFYQQNGIFGSQDAVANAVQFYSSFFTAPVTVAFGSLGNGRLKALDLVSFSGLQIDGTEYNQQVFRLTSINNTIEPQNNMWTAKYEGEWQFFNGNIIPQS